MPAWDNVQLAGPPNGPAWANAAAQMMNTVGNQVGSLGDAYQSGVKFNQQNQLFPYQINQAQFQQNQRDFFQDPNNQQLLSKFLQQPTQQNYAALMQPMIQAGGMQAAGPMLDQYLGITQDQNIANRIGGGGGQPPPTTGPATSSSAASHENITGKFSTPKSTAGNNYGGLNRLAADSGTDLDAFLAAYPKFNSYLDQESLTPAQENLAKAAMRKFNGGVQGGGTPNRGGISPIAQSGGGDQEAARAARAARDASESPRLGEGSPAMTPPQGPERRIAQAATFNDRFGAFGDRSGERPTPLGDMPKVDAMNARIQQLRADAARYARRSPAAAQQADKAADDLVKERDKIEESISKYNEPGRTQRDVESGATLTAERIKNDTERYGKQYDAYQTRADNARQLVSTISANKAVMNSPGFYSGTGAEHVMALQNLGVALGLAPKDYAMANQVFGKTVAEGIMDQIKSLQGMGQIRVAEIKIMERAALNHDNSPSSNRMLAEMQDRLARNWTIPIADAATGYNNGHLDAGFDKIKQKIMSKPLFNEDELRDPRRIAPIEVRSPAELKSYGWRDGEPFRDANTGRIFTHLPKGAAPPAPVNPANQT